MKEEINTLKARVAELEAELDEARLIAQSNSGVITVRRQADEIDTLRAREKRWQALFEHAALVCAELVDLHGLDGDEASELIAAELELLRKEPRS